MKCAIRRFHCCVNVAECTYTEPDGVAYCTAHRGGVREPNTPRLQACTACYLKEQHDSKSSMREKDAIKRPNKHEMCEAAADVTWHPIHSKHFYK